MLRSVLSRSLLLGALALPSAPAAVGALTAPQVAAPAAPTRVDVAALDAYFARALDAWPVPGFSVAIVKDGEVVLERGYGVREAGGVEPVDEHTLYAIASNSKAFTAAALARLVDEGRLSWDDRVVDHLPWFHLYYDDYVSREMRIRDLLSHRSGLGTYSGDLLWYGTSYSAEEVVRRAAYLPAAFSFRDGYGYSNLMFIAAGEVLRAVTGRDWHEVVETDFLAPLGMSRSVTSTRDLEGLDNVATPHKYVAGETLPLEWYNWDAMGAAGGIISSVHDMSRWLRLQLAGGEWGGVRLFSGERQREMWAVVNPRAVTPQYQARYPSTNFRGYGLGWSLQDYLGHKVVSHGGGYDGMYSQVALVPDEGLGVVVLTNGMTGLAPALVYRVLDAYLGGEERDWSAETLPGWLASREAFEARQTEAERNRIPGTSPSLEPADYAGTYGGPMYGDAEVTLEDGDLVLRLLPNPDLVADLEHLHHDTFVIRWRTTLAWFGQGTAEFVVDEDGVVTEMKLDVPNDDLWFHELEMMRKGEDRVRRRSGGDAPPAAARPRDVGAPAGSSPGLPPSTDASGAFFVEDWTGYADIDEVLGQPGYHNIGAPRFGYSEIVEVPDSPWGGDRALRNHFHPSSRSDQPQSGVRIDFTPVKEVWAEAWVRFSPNWTTLPTFRFPNRPNEETGNTDHKTWFFFSYDRNDTTDGAIWGPTRIRYDLKVGVSVRDVSMGGGAPESYYEPGHIPPLGRRDWAATNAARGRRVNAVAAVFDARWHQLRWHIRLDQNGRPGRMEAWLDGRKFADTDLADRSTNGGVFRTFGVPGEHLWSTWLGANRNSGPTEAMWFEYGRLSLFAEDPGW